MPTTIRTFGVNQKTSSVFLLHLLPPTEITSEWFRHHLLFSFHFLCGLTHKDGLQRIFFYTTRGAKWQPGGGLPSSLFFWDSEGTPVRSVRRRSCPGGRPGEIHALPRSPGSGWPGDGVDGRGVPPFQDWLMGLWGPWLSEGLSPALG